MALSSPSEGGWRWGILGLGKIADDFATALTRTSVASAGGRLLACACRDEARSRAFGTRFGLEQSRCYGSYDTLAQDPGVDIVYIASTHFLHRDHVLLCLQAGKHVVCEKAIALNARQTEDMYACAKREGKLLLEANWTRFLPAIRRVRDLIRTGELGEVRLVTADFGKVMNRQDARRWLWEAENGGGALLHMGMYPVTLALLASQDQHEPAVQAIGQLSEGESGVDQNVAVGLRWPGGVASLGYSWVADTPEECVIVCSKGRVRIHPPAHCSDTLTIKRFGATDGTRHAEGTEEVEHFPLPAVLAREDGEKLFHFGNSEGLAYEVEAVHKALSNGLTECLEFTPDMSLRQMRVLDEIRRQLGVIYPPDEPDAQ